MKTTTARLDDPVLEAFGMLVEASGEVIHTAIRDMAATTDMPVSWVGVLLRLARTPGGELRMTQLANEMTLSTSGLTRLVDRVEAAGLVERRPCPGDRRGLNAVITEAGQQVICDILPSHIEHLERSLSSLDDDELEQLTTLLRRVRDGIHDARLGK